MTLSRVLLLLFMTILGARSAGAASSDETELLKSLPREERVRLLLQRTWEIAAVPVEGKMRIDGRLDEPAWGLAESTRNFYQGESNEGLPATEATDVRVLYDETNLYIGVRCFDSEPKRMEARTLFRDEAPTADDIFIAMIDAFNDHRSAVQFATNANGLQLDLLQNGETEDTRNSNWDTVWDAKGSRFPEGWEAEVVIPFKSLRFEPPASGEEAVFGIGFKRNIPRKNEEAMWPFVSNDSSWYRPAELGHLRGLKRIQPGRSIEVRPYALGGRDREGSTGTSSTRSDFGGDAKWGVTPGLTADFTVNTDFAQEEADVQQINFTRFSLFFPEKRQFFLEGERMFQFGIQKEAEMVFTRRIGLSGTGEAVPIQAGARLSGRQGPYTIAAMNIQTDEAFGLPAENFTVLRLRRDFLSRSSVGALVTNRQGGGVYNRVYGADLSLLLRRVWFVEGFLARVDEPGTSHGTHSGYGRLAYQSDRFGANYRYLDIGENFRPGVGFVRRPNSKESLGEVRFSPRPESDLIRQFHLNASVRYISNQQGVLETRERTASFSTNFQSGEIITFSYQQALESIDSPFPLRNGVVIPPGSYPFSIFETQLNTFRRRHTVLNVRAATGGFWSGERDTLAVGGNYRVNTNFGFSGDYEINWVDLPEGKFTTHLLSSRVQIAFRKELVLMSLLQYNSDTDQISSNIRFNWIFRPESDFFVVYNELDEWSRIFQMKNRSLVAKVNYLFTF